MSATSIDLSQIKTDALSAASTFRTLIGLGTSDTPTFKAATFSAGTLNGTVLDIAQTWGGTGTYTGLKYNVTDSGPSNAASLLMDLQVGGSSQFQFTKNRQLYINSYQSGYSSSNYEGFLFYGGPQGGSVRHGLTARYGSASNGIMLWALGVGYAGVANWGAWFNSQIGFSAADVSYSNPDTFLARDAANTLALRNDTSAQSLRIYKTYSGGGTNYERGVLDWQTTADVFRIGTEAGGTGTVRNIALVGGNVGIGTTGPAYPLDISGTPTNAGSLSGATFNGYLYVGALTLGNLSGTNDAVINANATNKSLIFSGYAGANTNTEWMRITSSGEIGIGTTSPAYKVDITSANDTVLRVQSSGVSKFAGIILRQSNTNTTWFIDNRGAADSPNNRLAINNGSVEAMTILSGSSGNVGIGLTSPAAKLDILDTTGAGSGSLQASALNIAQTWSTTGTPTALKLNVTDTASNAASLLMDLQVGGSSRFKVDKGGGLTGTTATLSATLDLTIRTVTYGATMAIDAALGNKIAITLAGNGTISNPTNAVDGRVLVFRLRQDATGSRIPVWDTKYAFVGDLATVTLSTAANKIDRVAFEYDSTDDKWYCISFIKGS